MSGLAVGVTTACEPDSRDATSSAAKAVVVSAPWCPSLMVTLMSYAPSCIGVHVNALAGLKSRTTWNALPCEAALNWYTGLAPTSAAVAVQVMRSPTVGESSLEASVAVPDSSLRFSRDSSQCSAAWRRGDGRTDDDGRRDFRE